MMIIFDTLTYHFNFFKSRIWEIQFNPYFSECGKYPKHYDNKQLNMLQFHDVTVI